MSKKTIIILVILAILVLGLAIGGYFLIKDQSNKQIEAKQKREVTLIVKTPVLQTTSYKDKEIQDSYTLMKRLTKAFEEQYQDANVKIELVQFEKADEDNQIIGCFDTNEATDILYEEYFNMSTYVHTGKVVPIDDIITEEIRNDIDDSYWDISTLNGKTYMMPYLGMQNTLCYNKELFKQAGLEKYITDEDVIQNWSLEDWEVILSN